MIRPAPRLGVRSRSRCCGDQGDAGPLEAVILMPVLLAVFGLVLVFGGTQGADNTVQHAASVAARAAASAQTMPGAQSRAAAAATSTLANSACDSVSPPSVSGSVAPGGQVTVTVTCTVDLGDVSGLIGVPGVKTLSATATEPVDTIRGGG